MRRSLRVGLGTFLIALVVATAAVPGQTQTAPTFTAIANQPNASAFFVEFFRHLDTALHDWWIREGRGLVKASWRMVASEAFDPSGTREGILLVVAEEGQPRQTNVRIRTTRDPAAAAKLAASTIIGEIERRSGKEVTEK